MKLLYDLLAAPLDFGESPLQTLVLESPPLYRAFLSELFEQTEGGEGSLVFSEDGSPIPAHKYVEAIPDCFHLGFAEDKRILTPLYKQLALIATHDLTTETYRLYSTVQQYLGEVLALADTELCFDEINDIAPLLKLYHVRPDTQDMTLAEEILLCLELYLRFTDKRLFVFCNLHGCFSEEEWRSFLCDLRYRQISALFVEQHDCPAFPGEQKTILDADACQI